MLGKVRTEAEKVMRQSAHFQRVVEEERTRQGKLVAFRGEFNPKMAASEKMGLISALRRAELEKHLPPARENPGLKDARLEVVQGDGNSIRVRLAGLEREPRERSVRRLVDRA